ncbi:flagellar hook protein FlgE [Variovorax arabinosiphilus]|uniref:flagellar hook protein FlgE n=1 Tax=Variovorax arabinosiphilus TaxID=3053498 RepID=UPI002577E232|nr:MULTISPECIES: flagellar hook-basal body complex protein [unclassified Variovorax]MDM0122197.1 flagellar hook-basal body complex protein [Variovorax sp. J2L1-78]MDM0131274.1 flagellar hook-basal body complex protein [Variovorax sp. J2L1-63]MDM0234960.1 flagellar hook-basal body complex protein [Variovorax sp. J2R1-6]
MLESIYVGMTGLLGYSRGLRVIANNTANLNTPGFKSSSMQFADLFYGTGNPSGGAAGQGQDRFGFGLNTTGTSVSFKQGDLRATGNDLDMAVDGQGMFVLQDAEGKISYSRAGQFKFDPNGVLVDRGSEAKVMGLDDSGAFVEISVAGLMTNAGKPTSRVKFTGNLSSTATEQTVGNVKVMDASGAEHLLSMKLTNTNAASPGSWRVDVTDGGVSVGSGQIVFLGGRPLAESASFSLNYAPAGQPTMSVAFDFGTDVTSFAAGNLSTLAMGSQDGVGPGALSGASFNESGVLVMGYSNGQTTQGARLALGRFDSPDAVVAVGGNRFLPTDGQAWHIGVAGANGFGAVRSGVVEISNVDLSQEFSDLVVMQRGYQASSQVISTANDMLQELFSMKSK